MANEKLRNLHRGKINLPCGLGSSRAPESFLLADLMLLRLGIVSVQASKYLCAPFWRTQICRKCWNWSCLGAEDERRWYIWKQEIVELKEVDFCEGFFSHLVHYCSDFVFVSEWMKEGPFARICVSESIIFSISFAKPCDTHWPQKLISHSENMVRLWWGIREVVASTSPVILGSNHFWKEDDLRGNSWFIHFLKAIKLSIYFVLFS